MVGQEHFQSTSLTNWILPWNSGFQTIPWSVGRKTKTSPYPYWAHSLELSVFCAVLWCIERICYREEEKASGCIRMGRTGDLGRAQNLEVSPLFQYGKCSHLGRFWRDSRKNVDHCPAMTVWQVLGFVFLFYHCTCNMLMHLYFIFIYYLFSEYLIWSRHIKKVLIFLIL